ncbi:MAG: kynureninase [Lysobacterales bacterium]
MNFDNTLAFARECDGADPLASFRDQFHRPQHDGKDLLYFTGNSLGLQPVACRDAVEHELARWAALGVEGHFSEQDPWFTCHRKLAGPSARLVGAKESEVVCMNSLTTNLHLLFVSFYRPTAERFKIISEAGMFPSDRYLLETQVAFHGFQPDEAIVEVGPRPGEHAIRHEDLLDSIAQCGDQLAMVFIGGINYFNGQFFDIAGLTSAAHKVGAKAGFDLAHAVGNVPLSLHDHDVDFAAWCTYKYLNAGPGNIGGAYVHERYGEGFDGPRFAGWWGHDESRRFEMQPGFTPMPGAQGWQLSNPPAVEVAMLNASLQLFDEVGLDALRAKSVKLTSFLLHVLKEEFSRQPGLGLECITPEDPEQRGCQLSVRLGGTDKSFFDELCALGVSADFRAPNVMRFAPAPFYNSFEDVWRLGNTIAKLLATRQ